MEMCFFDPQLTWGVKKVPTHIHVSLISDLLLATNLQSPQDDLASTNSYCMVQPDS